MANSKNKKNFIQSPYRDKIISETLPYAAIYNLVTKIGFLIFIIIIWIASWTIYIINRKKHE
jgi:Mn2+/Fe2+ NRAMP family transporter